MAATKALEVMLMKLIISDIQIKSPRSVTTNIVKWTVFALQWDNKGLESCSATSYQIEHTLATQDFHSGVGYSVKKL